MLAYGTLCEFTPKMFYDKNPPDAITTISLRPENPNKDEFKLYHKIGEDTGMRWYILNDKGKEIDITDLICV